MHDELSLKFPLYATLGLALRRLTYVILMDLTSRTVLNSVRQRGMH